MKFIKKVLVAPVNQIIGSIVDTLNINDKTKNTYSARVIDEMNRYSTNETIIGYFVKSDGTKKNVYRKFSETNVTANGNIKLIETGSFDDIFDLSIYKKTSGNHEPFDMTKWWSNRSTGQIMATISSTGVYTCCVTYTKTTD